MTKTELVLFFKGQKETADLLIKKAAGEKNSYDREYYNGMYKAYMEAEYKASQLDD